MDDADKTTGKRFQARHCTVHALVDPFARDRCLGFVERKHVTLIHSYSVIKSLGYSYSYLWLCMVVYGGTEIAITVTLYDKGTCNRTDFHVLVLVC